MVAGPVIPATQEAEAGESLELRRWRLQWAKTMPLHSSLGNKSETLSQKKKKKHKEKNMLRNISFKFLKTREKEKNLKAVRTARRSGSSL